MSAIRIMTQKGEKSFREYIHKLRENQQASPPDLNSEPYSREFTPRIEVEELLSFASKMNLAEPVYTGQC